MHCAFFMYRCPCTLVTVVGFVCYCSETLSPPLYVLCVFLCHLMICLAIPFRTI
jgi:hypothetical protein